MNCIILNEQEKKDEEVSEIKNCILEKREDENSSYLFKFLKNGTVIVNLDGYAIIPVEKYNKLNKKKMCKKFLGYLRS